ncbi:hypothetical protein SISNIDRAFT_57246 [Sistotremastrum niveocremeum HHB9708]|uniref:Uncharacterized protein n=1 Tax=Sistotremastrum niveocremeum HHB9708 TaxID=1314777 RepID=A0A164VE00_9AGAM|nr:hypothetical protein SISNIDRAFT_57246 [Sistotremastrum niveocremeum HHB9708]
MEAVGSKAAAAAARSEIVGIPEPTLHRSESALTHWQYSALQVLRRSPFSFTVAGSVELAYGAVLSCFLLGVSNVDWRVFSTRSLNFKLATTGASLAAFCSIVLLQSATKFVVLCHLACLDAMLARPLDCRVHPRANFRRTNHIRNEGSPVTSLYRPHPIPTRLLGSPSGCPLSAGRNRQWFQTLCAGSATVQGPSDASASYDPGCPPLFEGLGGRTVSFPHLHCRAHRPLDEIHIVPAIIWLGKPTWRAKRGTGITYFNLTCLMRDGLLHRVNARGSPSSGRNPQWLQTLCAGSVIVQGPSDASASYGPLLSATVGEPVIDLVRVRATQGKSFRFSSASPA